MNKKNLIIVFLSIIFTMSLFIGIEIYKLNNDLKSYCRKFTISDVKYLFKRNKYETRFKIFLSNKRKPVGLKYKKKPILFLGCSYAYGQYLDENQIISYQISKKAKRPVYNWSFLGFGIQHAYYLLQNMPKIKPEPEYIFYIFTDDHLRRIFVDCEFYERYSENLQYKMKNGKLQRIDNRCSIFDNFYILYKIKDYFTRNVEYFQNYMYSQKAQNLFKDYANGLKDKIREVYPNAKFVILLYDYNYVNKNIKKLDENDIKVLNINELCNTDFSEEIYELKNNYSPNELVWDKVSDALVKEFDL